MASGMGSSNKLAEIWNAFGDERINAVAVLSNSYFFTEKIPLEGAKISDSEMESMVQMTISTMIPEGNFEIVYGYSISKKKFQNWQTYNIGYQTSTRARILAM